jgi:hypothetical protein
LGFAVLLWLARCLILVGWVEVRNPTHPDGLYPTY